MNTASKRWLSALMALAIAGLTYSLYQSPYPKLPEKVGVGITGYNFTNEGVQWFYVNGSWGGNLGSYSGGGLTCCVAIPAKWTSDLTVDVDWAIGHYDLPIEKIQAMSVEESSKHFVTRTLSKSVSIERFGEPGEVQVFFLPNDVIKVYSSNIGLGSHDEHPSGMHSPRDPNKNQEQ